HLPLPLSHYSLFFLFHHPPTIKISPLSLHDALPIYKLPPVRSRGGLTASSVLVDGLLVCAVLAAALVPMFAWRYTWHVPIDLGADRKSTRLNASHVSISYAVFCLKKKKK